MAKKKMDIQLKKCITPRFRVSFPSVFVAESYEGDPPRFAITMLFDKKEDLNQMKKACFNAAIEEFGSRNNFPKKLKLPFRNGDEKSDTEGYENVIFTTASCKASKPPGIVDGNRRPIINEAELYAGCYARAELIAFYYDKKGNEGISWSLCNVQKMGEGEPLSGRLAAEDVFDNVDGYETNNDSFDGGFGPYDDNSGDDSSGMGF